MSRRTMTKILAATVVALAAVSGLSALDEPSAASSGRTVSVMFVRSLGSETPQVHQLKSVTVNAHLNEFSVRGYYGASSVSLSYQRRSNGWHQVVVEHNESRCFDDSAPLISALDIPAGSDTAERFHAYVAGDCGAWSVVVEPGPTAAPVVNPSEAFTGQSFDRGRAVAAFVHNTTSSTVAPATNWSGDFVGSSDGCRSQPLASGSVCGSLARAQADALGFVQGEYNVDIDGVSQQARLSAEHDQTTIALTSTLTDGSIEHGGNARPQYINIEDEVVSVVGGHHRHGTAPVTLSFAAPVGQLLEVGEYTNATTVKGRGSRPGLEVSEFCALGARSFTIHDIAWRPDGSLARLHLTFEFDCGFGITRRGVMLHNTVVGPPAVMIDRASFMPQQGRAGDTGVDNRVVVTNFGPLPAEIGTVEIVGDQYYAFMIDNQDCAGRQLLAGDWCTIDVGFMPFGLRAPGYVAELNIETDSWFGAPSANMSYTYGQAFGRNPPPPVYTDRDGYWVLQRDGTVTDFGDARLLSVPIWGEYVQIVATPQGRGYWILKEGGALEAHGDATVVDHVSHLLRDGERATSMAPTPDGAGLWVFTNNGRALRSGAAPDVGDLSSLSLAADVVDSSATPDGTGVFMLGADGGVFALGTARFAGSVPQVLPGVALAAPIVGLVPDPDGVGYWLVGADGGVFAFDAPFRGSIPGVLAPGSTLDAPIVGMVPYGNGYLLVGADGGVFNFSDRSFEGSLGGTNLSSPVVSITALPPNDSYLDQPRSAR